MRRLAALADVALARPDLPQLLDEITGIVKELVPSTEASLILWSPDSERFTASASTLPDQRPRYVIDEVRDSGGASRWIIDERKPLAMSDIENDPFGASSMLRAADLKAYLGVPVLFEDEALGVLYALDDVVRDYTRTDIDFMTILARRASTAIGFTRLFEQIQELSRTDELTGVLNRREYLRRARREFDRVQRTAEPISVLLIDLDDFKQVNDQFGHAIGDHVLVEAARRCGHVLRAIDVFGRIGGEEFAVVLPATGAAAAVVVAERLRSVIIDTPIETSAGQVPMTATIGVAERSPETADLHQLVERADRALYAGKAAGRNRVVTA